jgi:hypothetical protein
VDSQPNLLEIIAAAHPACRFACGLDRGEQQSYQDANDGDNHQQLHKREAAPQRFSHQFILCNTKRQQDPLRVGSSRPVGSDEMNDFVTNSRKRGESPILQTAGGLDR